jgi:hypothetical protein
MRKCTVIDEDESPHALWILVTPERYAMGRCHAEVHGNGARSWAVHESI